MMSCVGLGAIVERVAISSIGRTTVKVGNLGEKGSVNKVNSSANAGNCKKAVKAVL
jgi:hypothetical protein